MSAYWEGPHGVKVPFNVKVVVAADGKNMRFREGTETEIGVPRKQIPSRAKYLDTYAVNRGSVEKPDWWYAAATERDQDNNTFQ
jgi:hypothetical protein